MKKVSKWSYIGPTIWMFYIDGEHIASVTPWEVRIGGAFAAVFRRKVTNMEEGKAFIDEAFR